jgi:small subunit ribosomal protein S4
VNGKVVNIPSFELRPGDIVAVRERSKSLEVITNSVVGRGNQYPWLEWDGGMMAGKFMSYPERDQIPENIKEQLIVELYSK